MKYTLWEEDKPIHYIDAEHIRFDGGVFFVHQQERMAVWDWDQAFTLKPGQFLTVVKENEESS